MQLNSVWSKQITQHTKIRVEIILTYDTWTITEQFKKKLLTAEMSFWRRGLMNKVKKNME